MNQSNKIVLYCKSFRDDVNRCKMLMDSIQEYNSDKIPVYVSVPQADVSLFKATLKGDYKVVSDEEINKNDNLFNRGISPRILAFSTRMNIWMTGIADNYLCLDSDGYFIKSFKVTDFMYDDTTPYTVCHEQKELFYWTVRNDVGYDPYQYFVNERTSIKNIIGTGGKPLDFGPNPVVWNAKLLQHFNENYLKPNNLTTEDVISYSSDEYTWVGEYLIATQLYKLIPSEPFFRVYHYKKQYDDDKSMGVTLEHIAKNYFGIILQSAQGMPLKY